ncbi:MAG: CDP-diacylglycerol--serine O-phosphatidyltransferase [Gemmatimonadetes bacterium]|nr:CDP-diacylglycerol--serine O-phosphatidyltransferase [Gemmatimonadota bacterium]MYK65478.1 CDP-diacylglycerol--serine O-phosphatidyltransferase [Gemmatimonadota bacterium]
MRRPLRRSASRGRLRRGVIILPSAFTLGNLFFGLYAVVAALRGDFAWAGWFIVFSATLDLLDGRVARFTRTGSAFGAELDSLTDAISFGVAPALIMILLYFTGSDWSWVIGFVYVTAVVVRLARFNVEQGGEARRHFHGLPTPTAGMILGTHYPFSQTAFAQQYLGDLNWPGTMVITMVLISILMLSHVPYAKFPRIDLKSRRGMVRTSLVAVTIAGLLLFPAYGFFPFLIGYTLWGLLRSVFLGLLERLPERDPLLDAPETPDGAVEPRDLDYHELTREPNLNDWKENTS